jgi:hypothetical protein
MCCRCCVTKAAMQSNSLMESIDLNLLHLPVYIYVGRCVILDMRRRRRMYAPPQLIDDCAYSLNWKWGNGFISCSVVRKIEKERTCMRPLFSSTVPEARTHKKQNDHYSVFIPTLHNISFSTLLSSVMKIQLVLLLQHVESCSQHFSCICHIHL